MDRPVMLAIVAILAAGAAYVIYKPADDEEAPDGEQGAETETSFIDEAMSTVNNVFTDVPSAVNDGQVQAFLALISTGEGTTGQNGYRTLFGGGVFDDYADHPRRAVTRGALTSTAAGKYQILSRTWDEIRDQYGLVDFSPMSQDIAAVGLIKRRGALADVLAGRFVTAIRKCNKEWASLPGSPYGQPTLTIAKAAAVLAQNGYQNTETIA